MNGSSVLEIGIAYGVPVVVLTLLYGVVGWFRSRSNEQIVRENEMGGLTEPPSLHPLIDDNRCLGCGACIPACPEGDVLGLIRGKAVLTNPTHCIGHGACVVACPTEAIDLVLGTENRGVTVPVLDQNFETTVPGLYVAGELGGMGLIRNAIEQGRQAIAHLAESLPKERSDGLDLLIIGAGPAGLSAALAARELELRHEVVDQDTVGGTIAHYPRGKIVMTAPAYLPLVGQIDLGETSKESLMMLWEDAIERASLVVRENVRVESISHDGTQFETKTASGTIRSLRVLLAIGRRGSPRRLGAPGEDLPKVVYRLVDPEQYRDQRVLVVGGGDSALEAACSIAEEPGTTVTLSYRGPAFQRAKLANRDRVEALGRDNRLTVLLESSVESITPTDVEVTVENQTTSIQNDTVIVCAGGELPTEFLKNCGIEVVTHHGSR